MHTDSTNQIADILHYNDKLKKKKYTTNTPLTEQVDL